MSLVEKAKSHANGRETRRLKDNADYWKRRCAEAERLADEAESRLEFAQAITPEELQARELARLKAGGEATAILVLSDWHWGERVDPTTVNGMNAYSPTIARKRADQVFQRTVMLLDQARHLTKVNTLVVALLGDFITGYIHEELVEGNYLSPTEEVLEVRDAIHSGIQFLLKEAKVKHIDIVTSIGNHGRTTPKKRIATGFANSYEWLLFKVMESTLRHPRIAWKVENGYHNWLDIQGRHVRFHHGDHINYWGGVGGITIPVNKAIAQWNKSRAADEDVFGHFHQFTPGRRWTCNGSLIGWSPFGIAVKAEFEEPQQGFIVISKKRGKTQTLPVFCS